MADPITLSALALTAAGGATTAFGTIVAGQRSDDAAQFKAAQLEGAAAESRAAASNQAFERRREATLTLSSLQARAAAFAGDASDPGVVKLGEDIANRGEYRALSEMYTGENRARGLIDAAKGARAEGAAAEEGAGYAAAGTLLSSAGSMFKTYGTMSNPGGLQKR